MKQRESRQRARFRQILPTVQLTPRFDVQAYECSLHGIGGLALGLTANSVGTYELNPPGLFGNYSVRIHPAFGLAEPLGG